MADDLASGAGDGDVEFKAELDADALSGDSPDPFLKMFNNDILLFTFGGGVLID